MPPASYHPTVGTNVIITQPSFSLVSHWTDMLEPNDQRAICSPQMWCNFTGKELKTVLKSAPEVTQSFDQCIGKWVWPWPVDRGSNVSNVHTWLFWFPVTSIHDIDSKREDIECWLWWRCYTEDSGIMKEKRKDILFEIADRCSCRLMWSGCL